MRKETSGGRLARAAFREHRALEKDMVNLASWRPRRFDDPAASARRLARELRRLGRRLRGYFDREERSGLVDDILERLPSAEAALGVLKAEHPAFLARIESLARRLERAARPDAEGARRELARLFVRYRRHEDQENELFLSAYSDDVGSVD